MWSFAMLDASGKPGASILKGNHEFLGNYQQCRDVTHDNFTGHTCRASISASIGPVTFGSPGTPTLDWDFCLPSSCKGPELTKALDNIGSSSNASVSVECTPEFDLASDTGAIVSIVILSIFGILVLVGTFLDVYIQLSDDNDRLPNKENARQDDAGTDSADRREPSKHVSSVSITSKWQEALLAFSLPKNTGRILSTEAGSGTIGCLHGIRVLSLAWVILGHVVSSWGVAGVIDPADFMELTTTMPFQFLINGTLSVDSFFFLSGFLTSYLFIKGCWKKGVSAKTMGLYYFHRYWRLTPPMMVVVMITANLIKYIGEGLPDFQGSKEQDFCKENWWHNLLYINTLIKNSGDDGVLPFCVSPTWFLSMDMIFYVVAPLVLVPLVYRHNVLGFLTAAVMIGVHLASNVWLVDKYNFDLLRHRADYMDKLYFKPWARVAPYAIGLVFGWIYFKLNNNGKQLRLNKCSVALGWLLAIGLAFTITMVTYDDNKDSSTIFTTGEWPMEARLVHETLSRPLWALLLGWVVVACSSGYGGVVDSLLSWEGFLPLSRLTYSAFLCHWLVVQFEAAGQVWSALFSLDLLVYKFFGFYVVSYSVAFLLAVFVEAPLVNLEKVLLK